MNSISENISKIRQRIDEAIAVSNRSLDTVKLIAVSKTKPDSAIKKALEAHQYHFGENRMQELQSKMLEIKHPKLEWHMIGTLQTNKIKYITNRVNWIHSVDKVKYFNEINKRAAQANRSINVLIQVNISKEDQKGGCKPSDIESILESARNYEHVTVRGLMGMARFTPNPEEVREEFALLRTTLEMHTHLNEGNIQLNELSMGMSNDFFVAIEEGATMVRVGSSIFGSRNYG